MYPAAYQEMLNAALEQAKTDGLFKEEHAIAGGQDAWVTLADGRRVLNMCANNYLGLSSHPAVVQAARAALDVWGYGVSSVRFICGTQSLHQELEAALAEFLGTEDAILYSSCFDANGGTFETLFGEQDAIISDELNHASLIDGIRLSKSRRLRYKNADMADLRAQLISAVDARRRVIVTDGVFSMDGSFAPLDKICDLADEYDALVMVDDSHAVGFVGNGGRGTPELFNVMDRVDILTGTLGKALGGASGGYLFSNAVAPSVVAGSMAALDLAAKSSDGRETLTRNTTLFRALMTEAGFDLLPGTHPITPVMFPGVDGARTATAMANAMLDDGIYVIAFTYPVVPRGKARIRVQLSAAHSEDDVRRCVDAFVAARATVG
jgi:glycine C-acetyltransferase